MPRRAAGAGSSSDRDFPATEAKRDAEAAGQRQLARVVYVSYGYIAMLGGEEALPRQRDGLDITPTPTPMPTTAEERHHDFVLSDASPEGQGAGAVRGRRQMRQSRHRQHDLRRRPSGCEFRRPQRLRALPAVGVRPASASRPRATASRPIRCRRRPVRWSARCGRASSAPAPPLSALDPHFNGGFARDEPIARAAVDDAAGQHPRCKLGAMSAVYGGAFHPSAEGQAVMADAALPAARAVLGFTAPPEVVAQPLQPLPPAGAVPDVARPQ